jgi:hypothetical protein
MVGDSRDSFPDLSCAVGGAGLHATPVLVGTTTDPTGINDLVVDGTTYDVTFSTTTLNTFTAGSTLSPKQRLYPP